MDRDISDQVEEGKDPDKILTKKKKKKQEEPTSEDDEESEEEVEEKKRYKKSKGKLAKPDKVFAPPS
jgi:hypothetical protein